MNVLSANRRQQWSAVLSIAVIVYYAIKMIDSTTEKIIIGVCTGGIPVVLLVVCILVACCLKRKKKDISTQPLNINSDIRHPGYDSFRKFEDYIVDMKEIKFLQVLGEGSYGKVSKATYRGSFVAVKKMKLALHFTEGSQLFINEVLTLSKLRNHNIVQFIGINIAVEKPCIIMEYMQGGSVADKVHKEMRQLDLKTTLKWAIDAAKGMEFLHAHQPAPILHRDLKSDNLLVDENGLVKVADFGTAKLLQKVTKLKPNRTRGKKQKMGEDYATSFKGTICWAAPEVVPPRPPRKREKFTTKADVYSFGITLWEMVSNRRPFRRPGFVWDYQIMDAILNGDRPVIPKSCPSIMMDLMELCWHPDKAKRPSFKKINEILGNLLRKINLVEIASAQTGKRTTFPPSGASFHEIAPFC